GADGYLWVGFVLAVVALIVLVARDSIARLPGNLPRPEQMLVGATGLAVLLTILGAVQRPAAYARGSGGVFRQVFPNFTMSINWSYGGFVALAAALVAFLAPFGIAGPLEAAHPAAQARLPPPGSSA